MENHCCGHLVAAGFGKQDAVSFDYFVVLVVEVFAAVAVVAVAAPGVALYIVFEPAADIPAADGAAADGAAADILVADAPVAAEFEAVEPVAKRHCNPICRSWQVHSHYHRPHENQPEEETPAV